MLRVLELLFRFAPDRVVILTEFTVGRERDRREAMDVAGEHPLWRGRRA